MKTLIKIAFILLLTAISSCSGYKSFQPWTTREKTAEALYLLSSYIDYNQTINIRHDPYAEEMNPDLKDASDQKVRDYFIVTRIVHYFIADYMNHEDRLTWLGFTLGGSAATIYWNYSQGF